MDNLLLLLMKLMHIFIIFINLEEADVRELVVDRGDIISTAVFFFDHFASCKKVTHIDSIYLNTIYCSIYQMKKDNADIHIQ